MPSVNEDSSIFHIIVQNSSGVKFLDGPPNFGGNSSSFQDVQDKIKYVNVSANGQRLAWICNGEVRVVEAPEWKRIGTLQHPKALEVFFSPSGKYLAVFDVFSHSQGTQPTPNLSIYDVMGRKLLKAFVQKSHEGWRPQWTKDEFLMARMVTSEVHFYEGSDLDNCKQKATFAKLRSFSLAPSIKSHHCTLFVPSVKSAPGFIQLLKYPHFKDSSNIVARQSFFKVDSVEAFWNKSCTAVLILTTAEVDKSGASYYGDQMLFFLSTRGDSNRVSFSKSGNIRSVTWCPSGKEFFCVYGSAPAKATLFNLKCDPVREFGEGARNHVLVNSVGNLVLIGGIGNISSRFEIWDIKEAKKLGFRECPDITHMEWSPCGKYILTSTCSPRLRVNNGFRVWHYSTTLLHENPSTGSEELYSASWRPNPGSGRVESFEISAKQVAGIQFQVKKASNERYIPPSQRAAGSAQGNFIDMTKKFLSQREEPISDEERAKALKKQKKLEKRKDAKKVKDEQKGMGKDWREKAELEEGKTTPPDGAPPPQNQKNVPKRKKNISKRLKEIEDLKSERDSGVKLDNAQLRKIKTEEVLKEELEQLSIA